MKIKTIYIFLFLFLVSFVLRFVNINKFPPSPNWDEVSIGYNAYSILKTGKDEWGSFMPLIFRCYGDFKLPLYLYFSVPFVAVFGLNIISTKLVSILAGSILPFIIFLIVQKIFPKQKLLSFLVSLIISLSPSFIFLSRIALEANLFLLLFCISIYFLLQSKFSSSCFFYALCLFTYNSSRVLLPFYLILLTFLSIREKYNIRKNFFGFAFLLVALMVFLTQIFGQSGQARYKWVSIIDSGAINQINELQTRYSRFLFNKATYFVFNVSKNYLAHFDPRFVFFNGGSNYQFNIPNFYLISPLFLPFFIVGFIFLVVDLIKKYDNKLLIILFWLLVSPIPSSVTRDAPHTLRSIVFLPSVVILIAFGIVRFFENRRKNFLVAYIIITLLISQFTFWPKYFQYCQKFAQSWQYGYKEAIDFIKANYSKYDHIFMTKNYGEPHEFILFYWPWNSSDYQTDKNKVWDYHADWYWIDAFDKFKFINDWEIKEKTKDIVSGKNLLITTPDNFSQNGKIIKTIYFPDNKKSFDIVDLI